MSINKPLYCFFALSFLLNCQVFGIIEAPSDSLIIAAVSQGDLQALKSIPLKNLRSIKDDQGNSLLHIAIFNEQPRIVNYLLRDRQLNLTANNKRGLTPLALALKARKPDKHSPNPEVLHSVLNKMTARDLLVEKHTIAHTSVGSKGRCPKHYVKRQIKKGQNYNRPLYGWEILLADVKSAIKEESDLAE